LDLFGVGSGLTDESGERFHGGVFLLWLWWDQCSGCLARPMYTPVRIVKM
jgi:hypothetical protein